jgi:glycosyltransferase involved in cell wall biosynthesis
VDALFVHSTDGASRLRREGIDGTKIWTLTHPNLQHVAGPPISSSAARQKLGLPSGSRVLLFFGVIEARKGLDILIDAFALLARAHPELWLAVAGAAPGGFEPYAAQIDARSVRERVVSDIRYLPFEEISTYFSAAEIVVLPYRRIVQSGILQLAYGFERPVVVSNVGGISETVQEDGTGVVAASLKAEDLAAAIDQLLRSPDLAAAMAARGRRLSDTKYSWQTVATQIADAYQAVLGRTSRPAP